MYKVYLLNKDRKGEIDKILSDDTLGRQTIVQKDGTNLGKEGKIVLIIEGQESIFSRVHDVMSKDIVPLDEKEASEIYKKIKDEDEEAESGVGFLFGP